MLRRESSFFDEIEDSKLTFNMEQEEFSALSSYKTEGDPSEYEEAYISLINFIERSLDSYKVGLPFIYGGCAYLIFERKFLKIL